MADIAVILRKIVSIIILSFFDMGLLMLLVFTLLISLIVKSEPNIIIVGASVWGTLVLIRTGKFLKNFAGKNSRTVEKIKIVNREFEMKPKTFEMFKQAFKELFSRIKKFIKRLMLFLILAVAFFGVLSKLPNAPNHSSGVVDKLLGIGILLVYLFVMILFNRFASRTFRNLTVPYHYNECICCNYYNSIQRTGSKIVNIETSDEWEDESRSSGSSFYINQENEDSIYREGRYENYSIFFLDVKTGIEAISYICTHCGQRYTYLTPRKAIEPLDIHQKKHYYKHSYSYENATYYNSKLSCLDSFDGNTTSDKSEIFEPSAVMSEEEKYWYDHIKPEI